MADAGRKDFTDKAHDKLKPESQKTYTEAAGDKITGALDTAARNVQPGESKSTTQKAGDALSGGKDSAESQGKTWTQSAQEAVSNVAQAGQNVLNSASETISGTAQSAQKEAEKKDLK